MSNKDKVSVDSDPFFIPGQTFAQWQERRRYYPDQIKYIRHIAGINEYSAHKAPFTVVTFITDSTTYCSECQDAGRVNA